MENVTEAVAWSVTTSDITTSSGFMGVGVPLTPPALMPICIKIDSLWASRYVGAVAGIIAILPSARPAGKAIAHRGQKLFRANFQPFGPAAIAYQFFKNIEAGDVGGDRDFDQSRLGTRFEIPLQPTQVAMKCTDVAAGKRLKQAFLGYGDQGRSTGKLRIARRPLSRQ